MSTYCKQCCAEVVVKEGDTSPEASTARNDWIVCDSCGGTFVDAQGRCTGACGHYGHNSLPMRYIYTGRGPEFQKMKITKHTWKTNLLQGLSWVVSLLPKAVFFTFTLISFVLVLFSLRIETMRLDAVEKTYHRWTEYWFILFGRVYEASFRLWYTLEIHLERKLF